jgi:hypothetical protein
LIIGKYTVAAVEIPKRPYPALYDDPHVATADVTIVDSDFTFLAATDVKRLSKPIVSTGSVDPYGRNGSGRRRSR